MLGGSVQIAVPLNKTLVFTAAGGYNYFFGKTDVDLQVEDVPLIDYLGIKSVPVKLGLKYYFNPLFYFQGEAGGAFFSGGYNNTSEATVSFIYAPQVGIDLPLGNNNNINIGIRYESTVSGQNDAVKIRFLGLHAGYGF